MIKSFAKLVGNAIAVTIAFKIAGVVVHQGMYYLATSLEKGKNSFDRAQTEKENTSV
jgi:hypothetical protein